MEHIQFSIWELMLGLFEYSMWLHGENVNWHYGFGLAGIFMLFGMLQFHFGQNIFGDVGLKPTESKKLKKRQ